MTSTDEQRIMRHGILTLLLWFLFSGSAVRAEPVAQENGRPNWLDRSHQTLELRTRKAAIWFDDFFGDGHNDEEPATMRTRVTVGWEVNRHDADDGYAKIGVKVRLPNLKERFYLELSNEDEAEQDLPALESRRPKEVEEATEDNFSAALRWIKRSTVKETIDTRLGLRSGPNIYLLGRHRRYHNLTKAVKMNLTPAVFLDSEYGAGIRLLTEFDHLFEHPGLIRFSVRGQFDNRSEGVEWRSGLSYTYRLSNKGAIGAGAYLRGASDGDEDIENYSASIRLRKQFWRSYLFYEIEPFVDWPASDDYRPHSGIAFSIQMVIGE